MLFEELHSLYGTHVSQRVKRELTASEFNKADAETLPDWLQQRAEAAHESYRQLLNNPLVADKDNLSTGVACRRWRDAEDLAYLVTVAADVGATARAS